MSHIVDKWRDSENTGTKYFSVSITKHYLPTHCPFLLEFHKSNLKTHLFELTLPSNKGSKNDYKLNQKKELLEDGKKGGQGNLHILTLHKIGTM